MFIVASFQKKKKAEHRCAYGDGVTQWITVCSAFLYLYVRVLLQKLVGKSVELLQCALLHCRFHSDNRLQYAYVLEGL